MIPQKKCSQKLCNAPESRCDAGEADPKDCLNFQGSGASASSETSVRDESPASSVAWTGSTFGELDLARIAARGRVSTITLIGASDAGKTSFLATLYLSLLNGKALPGYEFAGSWTLGGWENISHKLRWSNSTQPPSFPAHTPRNAARQPGLLHLTLRDEHDELHNVLFADAPGEWFERWAVDRADPRSEGARWLERHADAVAVLLDSERLSDPERRGGTRSKTLQLLTRVEDAFNVHSCAVVWAKHDAFVHNAAIKAVENKVAQMPGIEEFKTISANNTLPSSGVVELAAWLVNQAIISHGLGEIEVPLGTTPFAQFRGRP